MKKIFFLLFFYTLFQMDSLTPSAKTPPELKNIETPVSHFLKKYGRPLRLFAPLIIWIGLNKSSYTNSNQKGVYSILGYLLLETLYQRFAHKHNKKIMKHCIRLSHKIKTLFTIFEFLQKHYFFTVTLINEYIHHKQQTPNKPYDLNGYLQTYSDQTMEHRPQIIKLCKMYPQLKIPIAQAQYLIKQIKNKIKEQVPIDKLMNYKEKYLQKSEHVLLIYEEIIQQFTKQLQSSHELFIEE